MPYYRSPFYKLLYFSTKYKSSIYPQYTNIGTIFKTIENKDDDSNVIDTQVVSFIKARKIAQDELNKSLAEQARQLKNDADELKHLEELVKGGLPYEKAHAKAIKESSVAAKEHAVETKGAAGSTDVFVEKQKQAQIQLKATTVASKAAKIGMQALATVGNMFLGMAISWVVSTVFKSIDGLIHKSEKIIEASETAKAKIEEINTELENNKSTIDSAIKSYKELADGVDLLSNKNISLSDDEYKNYLDLNNNLAKLFPSLISGFDNEGNAILDLGDSYETATKKLNALIEAQQKENAQTIKENMPDVIAGINEENRDNFDYLKNTNSDKELGKLVSGRVTEQITLLLNQYGDIETALQNIDNNFFDKMHQSFVSDGTEESLMQLQYIKDFVEDLTGKEIDIQTNVDGKSFLDLSSFSSKEFLNIYKELYNSDVVTAYINEELQKTKDEINNSYKSLLPDIFSVIQSEDQYSNLDESVKSLINKLVSELDYSSVKDIIAENYNGDIFSYLNDTLLNAVYDKDTGSQITEAYNKLLSINPEEALSENIPKIEKYISQLANLLGRDENALKITLGYDLEADKQSIQNIKDRLGYSNDQGYALSNDDSVRNKEINDFVNSLNKEDLSILATMSIDEDTTIEELKQALEQAQAYADGYPIDVNVNAVNALSDLKTGFKGFEEIFDRIINNEEVDSDLFSGLNESIQSLSGYKDFVDVLTNSTSTIEEQRDALNELATEYIDNSELIKNLTAENSDYVVSQLEEMGVTNALEVVNSRLINSEHALADAKTDLIKLKGEEYAETIDLENATTSEIQALYDEASASGLAAGGLANLLAQKYNVNNLAVATSGDCKALAQLFAWSKGAASALNLLAEAKQRAMSGKFVPSEEMKQREQLAEKEIEDALAEVENINYGGSYTNGSGGGGGSSEKEFSQLFDWIERRIKHFQTQFDRWLKQAETALTSSKIEKYYNKVAKQLEGLMDTYSKGYNKYIKLADKVDLDEEYKEKVRTGKISLETIKDEDLASKIEEYQEYYDKAQEYLDSYTEQAEKLANIPLDKAATKIERLNEKIELLDAKIDNTSIDNYKKANKLIDKEENQQKKILDANEKAEKQSAENLKSARKSLLKSSNLGKDDGISSAEKKKIEEAVKNGKEVDLSFFKEGSSGYKAALKYNEMLKANAEAIQEAALAQEEYNAWLEESAGQKFENIQTYYEKQVELLQAQTDEIQNQIDLLEARGQSVTAKYYQDQIGLEKDKLEQYALERKELEKQLQATEKLGLKGTETWYEMKAALADLNTEINESNINIAELNKSITELADKAFKKILEIRNLNTEVTDWAVSLMDNMQKFYEGTAIFNEEGMSELYAYVNGYKNSSSNSGDYKKLIEDLVSKYNSGTLSFTDVLGKQRNYNSLEEFKDAIDNVYADWREQISTTYDYENKVVDMMRKKLEQELAIMKELIDSKKDALSAEKDLRDYQASIQESTQNIGSLQKQIAAVQGDTSEEGVARIQQLQSELSEAQKDLEDKEYDRYISDQQNMLDKMSQEYSDLIASEMNDIKGLLQDGLAIMSNINTVLDAEGIIGKYFAQYNYEPNKTKEPEVKPETTSSETQSTPETSSTAPTTTQPTGSIPVPITIKPDGGVVFTGGGTVPIPEETKEFIKAEIKAGGDAKKDKALEFIDKNVKKAEKKKSEYSDVNKKIYSLTSGKILSSANLKKLAKTIGVDYDDATKNGKLYKKLKSLGVKGFRHGGIGRLIKENGEDGIAMVRNGEGFIAPEDVPQIQSLIDTVPLMNDLTKSLTKLPDMSHIKPILDNINTGNIEAYYNFTLENCSNPADIIRAIQTDSNVRKALQEVTVNQLHKNASRLSVNKYK